MKTPLEAPARPALATSHLEPRILSRIRCHRWGRGCQGASGHSVCRVTRDGVSETPRRCISLAIWWRDRGREGFKPSSVSAATPFLGLHDILNSRSPLPPFGINVRLGRQVSIDRRRSSWLRLYGERRREGGRTSGGRR